MGRGEAVTIAGAGTGEIVVRLTTAQSAGGASKPLSLPSFAAGPKKVAGSVLSTRTLTMDTAGNGDRRY